MDKFIFSLATFFSFIITISANQNIFYRLSDENSCTGLVTEKADVDLICTYKKTNCTNPYISWIHHTNTKRVQIMDNSKYGLWNGSDVASEYQSILRIRKINLDSDPGAVTCALLCNHQSTVSQTIHMCVKHAQSGLVRCSLMTSEDACPNQFSDNTCDSACSTEEQLYDGGDCRAENTGSCTSTLCSNSYSDGVCHQQCNSAQCGYDGGDCLNSLQVITRETIGVVVSPDIGESSILSLLREITTVLQTLVKIDGQITTKLNWTIIEHEDLHTLYFNPDIFRNHSQMRLLRLKLIPQSCASEFCFLRVTTAAKYLSQHLIRNQSFISTPIAVIGAFTNLDQCEVFDTSSGDETSNRPQLTLTSIKPNSPKSAGSKTLAVSEIVGIALCGLALVVLLIGVIIACRYHKHLRRENKRASIDKKQQVQQYLDNIPDITQDTIPQSPSLTLSNGRSATSKDDFIPTKRLDNYRMEEADV